MGTIRDTGAPKPSIVVCRLETECLVIVMRLCLYVVDPGNETPGHKLRKVETLKMSVDEPIVKSKHRSGIRQYMKDKPTKLGLEMWVLADTSEHGLGYDVIMKLMDRI